MRPSGLMFNQDILLDNVCHLLLLLLALVHLLLQVGDLFRDGVKAAPVSRPVRDRTDECGVRVLKRLAPGDQLKFRINIDSTYCVFLPPSKLARCLEVDTKKRELRLLILADVLDRIDMEGDSVSVDR